ncbi:hypothetical protein ACSFBI_03550 [Variovorax sp. RB3P1]|uniref:hypothetical protein n=1 Tax=Variovorax sp. RB3P1 TaxID=3443732 RepID=UPI003F460890
MNSLKEIFFGVADGTRTHDDQNHNLWRRANIHAGCSGAGGKFSIIFGTTCSGLQHFRSQTMILKMSQKVF